MAIPKSTARFLLVYSLPILHVLGCAATAMIDPDTGWKFMSIVDYPVSLLAVGLAMTHDVSPLLLFGVFGTLWWYALSWAAAFVLDKLSALRSRRGPAPGSS